MDGLIGHTGFVGGHLRAQHQFEARFNTSNIGDINGADLDLLVCAAAPGSMFDANRNPDKDRAQIEALTCQLARAKPQRFVLISSIAVFAEFDGQDIETSQAFQQDLAYGRHRRELEAFCEESFPQCLIVRLPALFGTGLRKNFIFDLLNPVPSMFTAERLEQALAGLSEQSRLAIAEVYTLDPIRNMWVVDRQRLSEHPQAQALATELTEVSMTSVQFHHPETTYQYYDMSRIWTDVRRALEAGLSCLHLATEPLEAAHIHQHLLGMAMPKTGARLHREDMHTLHSGLWDRTGPYLADSHQVLEQLAAFFAVERSK